MMPISIVDWTLLAVAIVALLATLPGTFELALISLGALLPEPRKPGPLPGAREPCLAVIVPVYNEERGLAVTIRSLLSCDDPLPAAHIVVMACNTTDNSTAVAGELGCTVIERIDPTRRGKGYGLDYAFRELEGQGYDAYIVVDADTTVEHNFLNAFRVLIAHGAEAGQCILRVANPAASTRTRLLNIAFLAFTFLRPFARHRLGLSAGLFGNGFALRADTVKRIPYHCFSIAEDLEYHTRLIQSGVRVEFVGDTSVSTDMLTTQAGAKSQRERWEGGRLRIMLGRAPTLLCEILLRRRWRLVEPLLELLLLPLAYHVLFLMLILLVSGSILLYAIAGLLLVVAHVIQAMLIGRAEAGDWKALAAVPIYICWKLLHLGGIIRAASKSTPWKRTERGNT